MVKRAVLIGINYRNSQNSLNGCINDINNVKTILVKNCGYNPESIRVLTEDTSMLPTRENIEKSIVWLVQSCIKGDTLFFYYSGHGSSLRDASSDENDGTDEVIVPLDYETRGVISDDWMFTNLSLKVPTGVNLWAFTDCCHSGSIMDLKYNYKSLCALKQGSTVKGMPYKPTDWTDMYNFSLERSKEVSGNVCLFSGCQDKEKSADAMIAQQSQGAFSYCFIEFVKANLIKMADGTLRLNSTVKLRNLLKELNCRLDINGFTGQNTQLSLGNQTDIERTFSP